MGDQKNELCELIFNAMAIVGNNMHVD